MKPNLTQADLAGARYLALRRLARAEGRLIAELLQLYVLEGFIRRLGRSQYNDRFVLKGGMLMAAFNLRRATRDIDFLAPHVDNDPGVLAGLVAEIAAIAVDDGVEFVADALTAAVIRDNDVYPGVRVSLSARLATAYIPFSVDLNVGDPVVPGPTRTVLPVLLAGEQLEVLAYPKAMVVAEKLVTAIQRGRASTRWRDFADLFVLVPGDLADSDMVRALCAVADYRGVAVRPLGEVLVGMPEQAQSRWALWRERQRAQLRVPEDFGAVLDTLHQRTLGWILEAART